MFERARCFSRSRALLVLPCPSVSTTQFCGFPPVLMARASDGTDVPVFPLPVSSSNMGSPNGSLPDLTNIEQMVSSLAAFVTAVETNATSVSSGSSSARSWNIHGHSDGSTATGSLGSHGPGSSDDSRNTRRRLDAFSSPEDEQARSAVLLRSPCEQYLQGITMWIHVLWEKSNMPAHNKPVRIHCEAGSVSARFVFETRAKLGELSKVCSQIVLKCLYLARIGRLDIQ